jgi:hypothetical protein
LDLLSTGKIYRFSIRPKGIDTPEIKGGGTCHEKQWWKKTNMDKMKISKFDDSIFVKTEI